MLYGRAVYCKTGDWGQVGYGMTLIRGIDVAECDGLGEGVAMEDKRLGSLSDGTSF